MRSKFLAVVALAGAAVLGGVAARATETTTSATTTVLLDTPCRAHDETGVRITSVDLVDCGVPVDAVGVKLNVTVAQASDPLYVAVAEPTLNEILVPNDDGSFGFSTSVVNARPGQVNSNTVDMAIAQPGIMVGVGPYDDGAGRNARIVVDVLGWYEQD